MLIESIHIESFGGLKKLDISLSSAINIIEGGNEAGKSTVSAFIAWVLYGFSKTNKRLLLPLDGSVCAGSIIISDHGGRYSIFRSGEREAEITDLSTNRLCHTGECPGELFLGVPSDIFTRTSYVGQADGGYINGADIRESMENLLYSADETINTARAIKKLDELRTSLLYKNRKGGRLYEYGRQRQSLSERLNKASLDNQNCIALEGSLREAKETLATRKSELESSRRSIEFYETVSKLSAIDSVRGFDEREAKAVESYNALISENTFNGYAPDSSYIYSVREQSGEISRLKAEIIELDAETKRVTAEENGHEDIARQLKSISEYGGRKTLSATFKTLRRQYMGYGAAALICAVMFLLCGGVAVMSFLRGNNDFLPYVAAAGIIFLIPTIICGVKFTKPHKKAANILDAIGVTDAKALYSLLEGAEEDEMSFRVTEERLRSLRDRRAAAVERSDEKQAELDRLLALWNAQTPNEAVERAEKFLNAVDSIHRELDIVRQSRQSLRDTLGEYDEAALRERYNELKDVYLPLINAGGFEISAIRRRETFMSQAEAAMSERVRTLENSLAALNATAEKPASISDELYALDERILTDGERYKACMLAVKALTEASDELRESVSPRISKAAGALMSVATDTKYGELGVDADLSLSYIKDGRAVDASFMSAGTRDLAYISLRFALIGLLYAKSTPPVIFDESFSRLDDSRLMSTFKLLSGYSGGESQVILLTSQKRDAVLMKDVVEYNYIRL